MIYWRREFRINDLRGDISEPRSRDYVLTFDDLWGRLSAGVIHELFHGKESVTFNIDM